MFTHSNVFFKTLLWFPTILLTQKLGNSFADRLRQSNSAIEMTVSKEKGTLCRNGREFC